MSRPGDPALSTIKLLFALSGGVCAFRPCDDPSRPACEQVLAKPEWQAVQAVVCHIRAASPGGPRYDPSMTEDERSHFDNLIVLCPNCANLIDRVQPGRFTVECLRDMKARHLERAEQGWTTERQLDRYVALVMGSQYGVPVPSSAAEVGKGISGPLRGFTLGTSKLDGPDVLG
jgi:hypothetical protein